MSIERNAYTEFVVGRLHEFVSVSNYSELETIARALRIHVRPDVASHGDIAVEDWRQYLLEKLANGPHATALLGGEELDTYARARSLPARLDGMSDDAYRKFIGRIA